MNLYIIIVYSEIYVEGKEFHDTNQVYSARRQSDCNNIQKFG
jgi:hypothetical protein